MADYHIGLDFGTSQTKVCLLNKNSNVREFLKFENGNYFLPSLVVKKPNKTFSYGVESEKGVKYRYFKMAAAEDEELIQVTNENIQGNLEIGKNINDYRKYSSDYKIKSEILVVLYLTYIYLFIKEQKKTQVSTEESDFFDDDENDNIENYFSINLGIPTEWHNPEHIKRKIKFQSLLLSSVELSLQYENLDFFLKAKEKDLLNKISQINKIHLFELKGKTEKERAKITNQWLLTHKLSVFPESAAGVNYLLKTKRLANGFYATLDIGAGTSDFALFKVNRNKLKSYFCSESAEIASNDFYREYAKQHHKRDVLTFNEIKKAEDKIRKDKKVNNDFYINARSTVKGFLNGKGIEFIIRKTFYRKYYHKLFQINQFKAIDIKNLLDKTPIIVFGGGANLEGFCTGNYCFWQGQQFNANQDRSFEAKPITDYINQVDIIDENGEVQENINLLVLALGLTYGDQNDEFIPFVIPNEDLPIDDGIISTENRYFYYDLQEAAFK